MKKQQQGGTILGFILGLVVGLGAAFGVAVYVSKVPVPFLNKAGLRGIDQDAAETEKNKNWDPNSPLYGKNPARPNVPVATGVVSAEAAAPDAAPDAAAVPAVPVAAKDAKAAKESKESKESKEVKEVKGGKDTPRASSADPLGDLVKTKAGAATDGTDPFSYFVQAGAFRTQSDADAQRAKLAMLGWEARVSEREQNGRTVFRVRVGPFDKRVDADQIREKLDSAKVESNLVRVQR
ncbi:SPOR domain-containing protein [Simplicispira psychrophila]|uniref:SPOR domain-containing protein n=1 Tax=Simplicispira psychrophila TaxID=80882 RepID=UPI000489ED12|nr:SPOR domain-containing protein [Simplicispira psychrophila]